MKILQITSKSFGGSGKYITYLCGGFKENHSEYQFDLLYMQSKMQQDAEIEKPFNNVFMYKYPVNFNPLNILMNIIFVYSLVKKNRYNIVHTHNSLGGFIGRIGSFFAYQDVKVIHTLHAFGCDDHHPFLRRNIFLIIEKFLDFFTHRYIAVSKYMKKYGVERKIFTPIKAAVIYNSIPLVDKKISYNLDRQKVLNKLNLPSEKKIILFTGRLDKQKNLKVILKALTLIDRRDFILVVCGEGSEKLSLQNYANLNNINDLIFWMGWQENLNEFYSVSDIFVHPSKWESFGLVFLEAMKYKLPIIASNAQAIPEIIEQDGNALLCDPDDYMTICIFLNKFLDSENLRKKFGSYGHKNVMKKFSYSLFIKKHKELYDSISK